MIFTLSDKDEVRSISSLDDHCSEEGSNDLKHDEEKEGEVSQKLFLSSGDYCTSFINALTVFTIYRVVHKFQDIPHF